MIKITCIFHWIKERALSSKLHVNVFHFYTYILEFRLSCDTNFYQKIYIANYLCWAPIISFDSSLKIPQTSQHFIGMRFLQTNLWWARQVWKVYTYLWLSLGYWESKDKGVHVHAVYCKHTNLSFKKISTLTALNESIDGILWNLEMSPSKWQAALSVTAEVPAECCQNQIKNRTNVSNGIFTEK